MKFIQLIRINKHKEQYENQQDIMEFDFTGSSQQMIDTQSPISDLINNYLKSPDHKRRKTDFN